MSNKKSSNGFFKFCRQMQKENPAWTAMSPAELVEVCSPHWCNLSLEGRSRYMREVKQATGRGVVKGGCDSYGRPLELLVNRTRQEEIKQEGMKSAIKATIDRALMNQKVEEEHFYLFHTNIFCITAEGEVVPAEMSLLRMSLRHGVEETYHVFIEPGRIPKGYRADCTENSNATHKIPLDLAMFNSNYQEIVEDVLEFLLSHSDSGELPPLFCLPKYNRQNQMVLAWLLGKTQEDLAKEVDFKLYSLPVLLYELARDENKSTNTSLSLSSLSGCDTKVPTISIAEAQLDRDMFIYTPGLSCTWHEDLETYLCTTATVIRWAYIMFSLCCPLYSLHLIPGKHCPQEELAKSISESITTTMSTCSGDTEYSREMRSDVTKDEAQHPLKTWMKANRKLATSVEEWEKFGYQEQPSMDFSSEKAGL